MGTRVEFVGKVKSVSMKYRLMIKSISSNTCRDEGWYFNFLMSERVILQYLVALIIPSIASIVRQPGWVRPSMAGR